MRAYGSRASPVAGAPRGPAPRGATGCPRTAQEGAADASAGATGTCAGLDGTACQGPGTDGPAFHAPRAVPTAPCPPWGAPVCPPGAAPCRAPPCGTRAAAPAPASRTRPASMAPAAAAPAATSTVPLRSAAPRAAAPASAPPSPVQPAAPPTGAGAVSAPMGLDFIARNQVVERYLSGRLPLKGATDFERFCHQHPELLDEIGLTERVHAGVRLLEASGKPEPWQEAARPLWQRPRVIPGLAAAVLVLGAALAMVALGSVAKSQRITALQKQA